MNAPKVIIIERAVVIADDLRESVLDLCSMSQVVVARNFGDALEMCAHNGPFDLVIVGNSQQARHDRLLLSQMADHAESMLAISGDRELDFAPFGQTYYHKPPFTSDSVASALMKITRGGEALFPPKPPEAPH